MAMYEFWFRQGATDFQIPLNPENINVSNSLGTRTFEVQGLGDVTIIKSPELLSFSFSSELPLYFYPGVNYRDLLPPLDTFMLINGLKNNGPVQFIVTNTPVNLPVTIQSFNVQELGGDVGTLPYDITLVEYRSSEIRSVQVQGNNVILPDGGVRADNRPQVSTYTVVPNDNLWKIAKAVLGDGARATEIADLNNLSANVDFDLTPGQVLVMPPR